MLDHIKSGADFMTTCLTTFRTGLPGDSSTQRTLYQFFRTKKHVLDAISRKKLYPFAWGGRGRKFKPCHSDPNKDNPNLFLIGDAFGFFCFISSSKRKIRIASAKDIFPENILRQIQKYVSGELIYIPSDTQKKKEW